MSTKKTMELWISGRVQGVFFRKHTQQQARALGLLGYVENLADGRVHVLATGTEEALQALLRWCHEGSPQARVDEVRHQSSADVQNEQFYIKH